MSASIFPIILGGAGIALAVKGSDDAQIARDTPKVAPKKPQYRDAAKRTFGDRAAMLAGAGAIDYGSFGPSKILTQRQESHTSLPREILDRAEQEMKKAYDGLTGAAKRALCVQMKKDFPGDEMIQQLDCDAPAWEALVVAGFGAAGAAAGTALCGPPCGALGAALAASVGKKAHEWVDDAYDSLANDVEDVWDESGEWIEEQWEDAESAVKGALTKLNPFD